MASPGRPRWWQAGWRQAFYPYDGDYGSDEVVAIIIKKYNAVELLNALIIALGIVRLPVRKRGVRAAVAGAYPYGGKPPAPGRPPAPGKPPGSGRPRLRPWWETLGGGGKGWRKTLEGDTEECGKKNNSTT